MVNDLVPKQSLLPDLAKINSYREVYERPFGGINSPNLLGNAHSSLPSKNISIYSSPRFLNTLNS